MQCECKFPFPSIHTARWKHKDERKSTKGGEHRYVRRKPREKKKSSKTDSPRREPSRKKCEKKKNATHVVKVERETSLSNMCWQTSIIVHTLWTFVGQHSNECKKIRVSYLHHQSFLPFSPHFRHEQHEMCTQNTNTHTKKKKSKIVVGKKINIERNINVAMCYLPPSVPVCTDRQKNALLLPLYYTPCLLFFFSRDFQCHKYPASSQLVLQVLIMETQRRKEWNKSNNSTSNWR